MFCSKCGTENDDSSVYCSKCGKKLKKQDSTNKNKILGLFKKVISNLDKVAESLLKDKKKLCISLGIMLAIIILNIGICVHRNNKDINTFKKAFNAAKYEDAKQVYSNAINNNYKDKRDKFDKKIGRYLSGMISDLQDDFINDKDRSDCSKELNALDQMYYYKFNSEEINKSKEKIKKYSDSRKAFTNGIKL
ncbi:zinc ribbon domain-containing protein, partial [Clostridium botulinum]